MTGIGKENKKKKEEVVSAYLIKNSKGEKEKEKKKKGGGGMGEGHSYKQLEGLDGVLWVHKIGLK